MNNQPLPNSSEIKSYLLEDIKSRQNDLYANTKYEIISSFLQQYSPLNILDVGCGSGELAIILAKQGHHLTGIDVEQEYITLARDFASAQNQQITFLTKSLADYNNKEHQLYDCVISTDVIEHISDDQAAITQLSSLVKPNGLMIIAVPAFQFLYGYHDQSIGHYRRYTISSLKQLLEAYCTVINYRYFGWTFIPLCLLYSKIFKQPYPLKQTGDRQRNPLLASIVRGVLTLDQSLSLPLGTSLILFAKRK